MIILTMMMFILGMMMISPAMMVIILAMMMMLAKGAMRCATLGAGRGMWHSERWHSFLEYHPHHPRYTHTAQPTGSPSLMIPNNHITNPAANQPNNYYQPTK